MNPLEKLWLGWEAGLGWLETPEQPGAGLDTTAPTVGCGHLDRKQGICLLCALLFINYSLKCHLAYEVGIMIIPTLQIRKPRVETIRFSRISSAFTLPVIYLFIHLANTYAAYHVPGPGRAIASPSFLEVTGDYSRKKELHYCKNKCIITN